jgi:hypothetical protein
MKLIIEITFPPNASRDGIKRLGERLPEVLKHDLMLLANAEVPDSEERQGGAEVNVLIS